MKIPVLISFHSLLFIPFLELILIGSYGIKQSYEIGTLNYYYKKITMEGTVKFFNESKGFGFIKPADSSEDVFVHISGCIDEIRDNDSVEYDVENGRKGLIAVNVKVLG